MCEFWYDYMKPKYGEKAKLCYKDSNSFIIYKETEYNQAEIAKDADGKRVFFHKHL